MINSGTIRNCTTSFPVIQGLVNTHTLGKIRLKNIYQAWQGESITQIKSKKEDNPFSLRIGRPSVDDQLKNDSVFFILHYLSYNPINKDIERREIVTYRNTERVFIGQSLDEPKYKDARLYVDGNAVVTDLFIQGNDEIKDVPVGVILEKLVDKVEKLQAELVSLRRQLNNTPIYNQISDTTKKHHE